MRSEHVSLPDTSSRRGDLTRPSGRRASSSGWPEAPGTAGWLRCRITADGGVALALECARGAGAWAAARRAPPPRPGRPGRSAGPGAPCAPARPLSPTPRAVPGRVLGHRLLYSGRLAPASQMRERRLSAEHRWPPTPLLQLRAARFRPVPARPAWPSSAPSPWAPCSGRVLRSGPRR